MGLSQDIVRFITESTYSSIPEEITRVIKNAFFDTVGVGIAGKEEPGSRIVLDYVKDEEAKPLTTVWGTGLKTTASLSAMVNGAMAHALDFDDVNGAVQGHPSTVLVPTILSVAEEIGASGKAAILAYFIGFEVMAYLGKVIGFEHYRKGWHGTATLGVFAAASAAGKLYGLTAEQMMNAMGIAASHASGTRQNFGTMTKPYHPGHVARSGIVSAKLAQAGFTAHRGIIEAPLGFLHLYGHDGKPATAESIGDTCELAESGISVKKYPCCFMTHRPADAMFELLKKHPMDVSEMVSIHIKAPKGGLDAVIHSRPQTGLEGKFSVEYVLAAVLLDGQLKLNTFTDEMVNRGEAQALLRKVSKAEDPLISIRHSAVDEGYVEVTVRLKNGQELTERVTHPKGSPQWPLTQDELNDKFKDCVEGVFSKAQMIKAIEHFERLERLESIKDLTQALACR